MNTEALRANLHKLIDLADEPLLNKMAALAEDSEIELTDELKDELDKHLDQYKKGEMKSYSFEEIEAYLLNKNKKAV